MGLPLGNLTPKGLLQDAKVWLPWGLSKVLSPTSEPWTWGGGWVECEWRVILGIWWVEPPRGGRSGWICWVKVKHGGKGEGW